MKDYLPVNPLDATRVNGTIILTGTMSNDFDILYTVLCASDTAGSTRGEKCHAESLDGTYPAWYRYQVVIGVAGNRFPPTLGISYSLYMSQASRGPAQA